MLLLKNIVKQLQVRLFHKSIEVQLMYKTLISRKKIVLNYYRVCQYTLEQNLLNMILA